MPDYNMPQLDVWSSFRQGVDLGGALRQQARQRQYGQAFGQGGWGAVAQAAGTEGDLQTAQSAQQAQTQQEEGIHQRAQRNATVLSNAATSLLGVPYDQRRQTLQQWAPMLEQMGFPSDQISQFDPTDENLVAIRAIQGQFSQYTDIRQQGDAIVGIRPDGSVEVLRQERPTAPTGYQWNDQGNAVQRIPGYEGPVGGAGMGGEQYQMLSPGEVEQMGLPPGSYQRNTANGQVTVVGRTRGQYTDSASSAAQYASRMSAANTTLSQLEQDYTDPRGVYLAQGGLGTEDERLVRQAQREFVNAILRRESGAVISPSEFASASQQYFPQPGDTPAVIEQKRAARQRAIQGLINASQGAYDEWYGEGSGAAQPPPPPPRGSGIGDMVGGMAAPAGGDLSAISTEELLRMREQLSNGGR